MKAIKTYFVRIGSAISQLINVLFGGHQHAAVSSKVGFFAVNYPERTFWLKIMRVIDFTFYPIDGEWHCINAYCADTTEDYKMGVSHGFWFAALCIVVVAFCIPLSILFWTPYLFIVKPVQWLL